MDFPSFSLNTSQLEKAKELDPGLTYDLLIVGGGPAAMSAAVYAARKMMNLGLVTSDFGGQVAETSAIENWLGFQSINAADLVGMFEEHLRSFDLPVSLGAAVAAVRKEGETFKVQTDQGREYLGRSVIVATGKRHRPLGVPGEKDLVGRGVAYCATCDAPLFRGAKVVVAGGGNSALTTALDLLKVEAEVTLVNFIKGWQADASLQKRVKEAGRASFLDYHAVVRIEGQGAVRAVVVQDRESEEEKRLAAEGVFVEIGLLPNSEPVRDLVELNPQGEVIVDCACRTSLEGLFGAGDVTTVPHKQIVIAAGEGAKAALSAYEYLVNRP